jgi:hypothetical protein
MVWRTEAGRVESWSEVTQQYVVALDSGLVARVRPEDVMLQSLHAPHAIRMQEPPALVAMPVIHLDETPSAVSFSALPHAEAHVVGVDDAIFRESRPNVGNVGLRPEELRSAAVPLAADSTIASLVRAALPSSLGACTDESSEIVARRDAPAEFAVPNLNTKPAELSDGTERSGASHLGCHAGWDTMPDAVEPCRMRLYHAGCGCTMPDGILPVYTDCASILRCVARSRCTARVAVRLSSAVLQAALTAAKQGVL